MPLKLTKKLVCLLFISGSIYNASAQVSQKIGTSPFNKNRSAVLELESTNKGFLPPRLTTAERNAIASPATGLMIYNTSENCLEWYTGTAWHSSCGSVGSSGGGAVVSGYTCSTASAGTMVAGIPVSGVTQTITAAVSTVGTYSISAVANGVMFSGSGTFSGTGAQNIVLTATGTPVNVETSSFVLNTSPSCSFGRSVNCGAYVASGVLKAFMCHNMGATTTLDPHVPVQGIHGDYYQWGRSTVVATASTSSAAIIGWNTTAAADGSWSDASKTANDPCPAGFRVPNKTQWDGVITYNTVSRTGSWVNDATNFTTAIHWGPNASTPTLTLPGCGYRSNSDGALIARGSDGRYYSSTADTSPNVWRLSFSGSSATTNYSDRRFGISVRCVSE